MYRFMVDDLEEAVSVLEDKIIYYEFDSSDRIMIKEEDVDEVVRAWESHGIDYDEI